MKRVLLLASLLIAYIPRILSAADWGGMINGQFKTENDGSDTAVSGNLILAPWVSMPWDSPFGQADFHFSAGLNAAFEDRNVFAPELFRLELSFRPTSSLLVRTGRIGWQDPSRFIAAGRFDGADFLLDLGNIKLGAAALYTGFLYKETADINISPTDPKDYSADFDWADFGNTYFAPRRALTALYGEFPGFPHGRGHLHAGLLAQFDLSDADERFHTQYLIFRHSLSYRAFDLVVAGALGLENSPRLRAAYAFSLEGGMQLPTAIRDRLSLGLRWSSGNGPNAAAFFPVTREAQGLVLQPVFSGMMIIRANYEARLLPSLSATLGGRYFIRTDSTSFNAGHLEDTSYFLGLELDGSLLWVPFSDLSFSMTGGVFIPKTGAAFADDAPLRWSLGLGAVFSF